jgi:hypothetical protein
MPNYIYIPEIERWFNVDGPYYRRWLTKPKFKALWIANKLHRPPNENGLPIPESPTDLQNMTQRKGRRCLHLLQRLETKPGCKGWSSKHNCENGLPAVPGRYCQTCSEFEDDGPF